MVGKRRVSRHRVRGRGDICTLFCKLELFFVPLPAKLFGSIRKYSLSRHLLSNVPDHQSEKMLHDIYFAIRMHLNARLVMSFTIQEDKLKIGFDVPRGLQGANIECIMLSQRIVVEDCKYLCQGILLKRLVFNPMEIFEKNHEENCPSH